MKTSKQKEIVMYESDEAASIKTVTGWVSREGVFWGDNEHQARFGGCTHRKCECGNIMERSWLKCNECRYKSAHERYLTLPYREYKGEPVVLWNGNTYFFSEDSIIEYLEENELEEVELLFCREQEWTPVESDIWSDIMPEDEENLPDALQSALDNLNKVISELPPCSYFPDKTRTIYRIEK